MHVFEAAAIIVAFFCIASIFDSFFKNRNKKPDQVLEKRLDKKLLEIEALQNRVEVLERIVTDRRFNLKREIDSLDDKEAS